MSEEGNGQGLTDPLREAGEGIASVAKNIAGEAADAVTQGQNPLLQGSDYLARARDAALGAGAGVAAAAGEHVEDAKAWLHGAGEQVEDAVHSRLDFNESDRLPWLESDDEEEYLGVDTKKVVGAVIGGVALLGAVVGGFYYFTHRADNVAPVADGSVIAAPSEPVKEAPKDAGGKQFDGTGDQSFAASQGQGSTAHLAGGGEGTQAGEAAVQAAASTAAAAGASFAPGGAAAPAKPAAAATPKAAPAPSAADAGTSGPAGGVVQIAAYSNEAAAQAGWNRLVTAHEMLKGMNHRIVSAKIDMGTVYRLQLVTSAGGGNALCEKLKADGLPCQVKH